MTPEDIGDIFQELEDALFAMAIRNIDAHKNWEKDEGFKWTQWQAEQIKGLREYREKVNIMTNKGFDEAKKAVEEFLQEAYEDSVDDAAGLAVKAGKGYIRPGFFGVNSDKMNTILDEAVKDIDTKRYACINRMNSGYADFLRKADIFAQSGSMTIPQALDYAMKDFLAAGLNCVEYSNGNRVNIASYAEMALRTSSSEVTRQANGDVRNALDEYLVVSNVIGMTCPYCQKWQGKVMIDDVYSDGKPDGEHRLVSEAKADHFLHPNCRHQLFMYIEGITEIADLPNDVETKEHYKAEQEQRRQEREIRKYKRLRDGAVDPADRKKYDARVKEWTAKHDQFLREHDYLRKNPKRLAPGYTGNGKPEIAPFGIGTNNGSSDSTFIPNDIVDAAKKSNPYYGFGPQYQKNCQRCVQAYEFQRRGFDVRAMPAMIESKEEKTIIWGNECFVDSTGMVPSFKYSLSENSVRDILSSAPDGSRHVIYVMWKEVDTDTKSLSHVFIAEKKGDKIYYIDPQNGDLNVESYFDRGEPNQFGIVRLDDKQIRHDSSVIMQTVRRNNQ